MAISSPHPRYSDLEPDWKLLRDSHAGERIVKEAATTYLPFTDGHVQDGAAAPNNAKTRGRLAYDAYKMRALFHNYVELAVRQALGKLHTQPAVIELPAALEPLRERATISGDGLDLLLMKIHQEQLISGRVGLMVDLPAGETTGTPQPYFAFYKAETIRNWDSGAIEVGQLQTLRMVILDESGFQRSGGVGSFEWVNVEKYRVLILGGPESAAPGKYVQGVFKAAEAFNEGSMESPNVRGGKLDEIPFVFINSMDLLADPDKPPLITLASLGMAIYRGEADYRQSLFMQGQDTLVTIGMPADDTEGAAPIRTGAGAHIAIPVIQGDAKFIGVDSLGLSEQREGLENDHNKAQTLSGQFVERTSQVESGDALRRRESGKTATLTDVAVTAAAGLERQLKLVARWMGANESEVVVEPNLDFVDDDMLPSELVDLMASKNSGAPISYQTVWGVMQRKGLTDFETFEDEIKAIQGESEVEDLLAVVPGGTGVEDEQANGAGGNE